MRALGFVYKLDCQLLKLIHMNTIIKIKRIYEPREVGDGFRVLVDRIWPRGLSKEKAHIDLWEKNIAPSTELRKWFNHDPLKWQEFQKRYHLELNQNKGEVDNFKKSISDKKVVTLLFAASDQEHNNAVALKSILFKKIN